MDGYKVDLKGITADAVSHCWVLEDDFFSAVPDGEIQGGRTNVTLRVKRTASAYELDFVMDGQVDVECDRCLELMSQSVHTEQSLKVVLGQEYSDDGDTVVVPENEGVIDLAWHMYEMIALAVPMRHVHAEGECNPQVDKLLRGDDDPQEEVIDSRWEILKKIKTNK